MVGRMGCAKFAAGMVAISLAAPAPATARSLADKLSRAISTPFEISLPGQGQSVVFPGSPPFFTEVLQRIAVRGADFPATSTTPGATFEYNPQLGIFEQSSSLGPVFAERADTVGEGHFEFGMSFLFGDLDEFDGGDFEQTSTDFGIFDESGELIATSREHLAIRSFSLEHSIFSFSATYGITSHWDVNLLMPVIYSTLRMRGDVTLPLFDGGGAALGEAVGPVATSGSAFGPGDLLLRSKYRLVDNYPFQIAGELALRFPTGREDDFQGLGDFTITPLLVMSRDFGPNDVHMNVGMEVNTHVIERTRVRYALGGSVQLIENVTFLADIIGSSSLAEEKFFVPGVPGASIQGGAQVKGLSAFPLGTTVAINKTNIVDFATGVKFNIGGHVVGYLGAILPLTDDGLRASVLPTASFEVPF